EEDHRSGKWTIQMAIDKVTAEGGGKICVKPGVYQFEVSLKIRNAQSLWLNGHGDCHLMFTGGGPFALLIETSHDVIVDNLVIDRGFMDCVENSCITINNSCYCVVVRHCTLLAPTVCTTAGRAQGFGGPLRGSEH